MTRQILEILGRVGEVISLAAVAVIVVGFALAAVRYALRYRQGSPDQNFQKFKVELGSVLTLGLELLVLADVIETITVEPTLLSLALLAFLVAVRTILTWTLSLETEGRWPWQPAAADEGGADRHA